MRIALLTLDSPLSNAAVAAFLAAGPKGGTWEVALLGRSVLYRPGAGGPLSQAWRHLRRSGPGILPYLLVNYGLPEFLRQCGRQDALARLAARHGLKLHPVPDVNAPAFREALRAARVELLVTFHFDQILAAETLEVVPCGGVNVHPSLLPRHRGPVPTIWAQAEAQGEVMPRFGVTLHRLAPRIDAGAILAQREVALPVRITASAAARALHVTGAKLLADSLSALAAKTVAAEEVTPLPYCPFPPPTVLRAARRRGGLVNAADLRAALQVAA
ncbi:formyltransferase family protein [Siccirubricoccus phaeus]|uniref:formyltransferase family protein n=1 Tax=Siccirubricoccus phaeus TaxID=2595053 RepID=UPI0011F2171F|nr:formyltransferase family protein [Siccirubricoccus phaeus]